MWLNESPSSTIEQSPVNSQQLPDWPVWDRPEAPEPGCMQRSFHSLGPRHGLLHHPHPPLHLLLPCHLLQRDKVESEESEEDLPMLHLHLLRPPYLFQVTAGRLNPREVLQVWIMNIWPSWKCNLLFLHWIWYLHFHGDTLYIQGIDVYDVSSPRAI